MDMNVFLLPLAIVFTLACGVLWWREMLPANLLPSWSGPVLRIIGAPTTVFCGQARAGKSSLLEFLRDHPVPHYRRTYQIETRLIVFHSIDGDKKIVLKNVHDIPADRLDLLGIDLQEIKPKLIIVVLDGKVIAEEGLDSCAANRLALHPASLAFEQISLSLRAHKENAPVKVIGVLINKADLWCADAPEKRREIRKLVEDRVRSYREISSAIDQGRLALFVRAIALTHPNEYDTPDALEDIARHSAGLSSETIREFKGKATDAIAQAADVLQVQAQALQRTIERIGRRGKS